MATTSQWKEPVRVVATSNVSISGLTTIDGVALVAGDRVLLANQTTVAENGIWLAQSGAWTRGENNVDVKLGIAVQVTNGTSFGRTWWRLTGPLSGVTQGSTDQQFGRDEPVLNVTHFGARGDGVVIDKAAIQAAHDALPALGGTLLFPDGTYLIDGTGLSFTKPVRMLLGRGSIKSNGTGNPLITVTANLVVVGHSQNESKFEAAIGGTAIKTDSPWGQTGDGAAVFEISRVRFVGGATAVDGGRLSTGTFAEGLFSMTEVVVDSVTAAAVILSNSLYYSWIRRCHFNLCYTALQIGSATETIVEDCIFKQSTSGSFSVRLLGCHHVEFRRCEFYGGVPNTNADVRFDPSTDLNTGYCEFDRCKFGGEREYWFSKSRNRLQVQSFINPYYGTVKIIVRGCEFFGPSLQPISLIGRSGGIATATVTSPTGSGHGIQAGDKIFVTQVLNSSFCGEFVVSSVTTTTVSWSSPGTDVSPPINLGGFIGSSSTVAIKLASPASQCLVEGSLFQGYGYACDDSFPHQDNVRDGSGRNIWKDNRVVGQIGLAAQEFVLGGHDFSVVEADEASPVNGFTLTDRGRERIEIRNRILQSEFVNQWPSIGSVSVTTGQSDPWGTVRAQKISRTGAAAILQTAGDNLWTLTGGEGWARTFDQTSLPDTSYFKFWAKRSSTTSTRTLFMAIVDGAGKLVWARHITLGVLWRQYRFRIAWPSSPGTMQFIMSPGTVDPAPCDCCVCAFQLEDQDGDYIATTTAAVLDASSGSRFDRKTLLGGGVAIGAGSTITKHLSGTTTWDPASIADGAMTSATVTVAGAQIGDTVAVGFSLAVPAGALLVGAVTAANTVTVTLFNKTGGNLNLGSGTLRADTWQH